MTSEEVRGLGCHATYVSNKSRDAKGGGGGQDGGLAVIVHMGFGNESVESLSRASFWVPKSAVDEWTSV